MSDRGFTVRALGEVAVRCKDYAAMVSFYDTVLGLERLKPGARGGHSEGICFFRLGESYGGHIAVLALFDQQVGGVSMSSQEEEHSLEAGQNSSLHHLALTVSWDEQLAAETWLKSQGIDVSVVEFGWVGWRGLFLRDPDGNTVELVAADPQWHLT